MFSDDNPFFSSRNPPDNWLRAGRNMKGFVQSPNVQTGFSSFKMANDFFDCLPNVDVISDGKKTSCLFKNNLFMDFGNAEIYIFFYGGCVICIHYFNDR